MSLNDANRVAAYSNPQLKVKHGLFGASLETGQDFSGELKNLKFNPKTGLFEIENLDIDSVSSTVIDAESRRVPPEVFASIRQQEMEMHVAMWKEARGAIGDIAGIVSQGLLLRQSGNQQGGQEYLDLADQITGLLPLLAQQGGGGVDIGGIDINALIQGLIQNANGNQGTPQPVDAGDTAGGDATGGGGVPVPE
jgi:hypothetical protein